MIYLFISCKKVLTKIPHFRSFVDVRKWPAHLCTECSVLKNWSVRNAMDRTTMSLPENRNDNNIIIEQQQVLVITSHYHKSSERFATPWRLPSIFGYAKTNIGQHGIGRSGSGCGGCCCGRHTTSRRHHWRSTFKNVISQIGRFLQSGRYRNERSWLCGLSSYHRHRRSSATSFSETIGGRLWKQQQQQQQYVGDDR